MALGKYLLLVEGEYNIGVVRNDNKVIDRIYTALKDHFSQQDIFIEDLKVNKIKNGIKLPFQFINDEGDIVEFTIEETWVY